jgi:hypothetical protein
MDFTFWTQEWPLIRDAPHLTIGAAIVVALTVWALVSWAYRRKIAALKRPRMALGKLGSSSHATKKQSFLRKATRWRPRFNCSAIKSPRTQRLSFAHDCPHRQFYDIEQILIALSRFGRIS